MSGVLGGAVGELVGSSMSRILTGPVRPPLYRSGSRPPRRKAEAAFFGQSREATRINCPRGNFVARAGQARAGGGTKCAGGNEWADSSPDLGRGDPIRTLLLDNYDSYTYNLYQLICVINGVAPVVLKNDEIDWNDLWHLLYKERAFHNVVISPGPGSPVRSSDIGICSQLLQKCHDIPVLGVCLGHQALGYVHGARILHAPEPVHGRLSEIEHSGHPLFASIPSGVDSGFKVVRYHSLVVDAAMLPEDLVPTAWTVVESASGGVEGWRAGPGTSIQSEDQLLCQGRGNNSSNCGYPEMVSNGLPGFDDLDEVARKKRAPKVLMGVSHRSWPHHGVQFHPESIATSYGKQLLVNFRNITAKFWERRPWQPAKWGSQWVDSRPLIARMRDSLEKNVRAAELHVCLPPVNTTLSADAKVAALLTSLGSSGSQGDEADSEKEVASLAKPGELAKETEHLRLHWKKLPELAYRAGGSKSVFCELFGEEGAEDTFWLDSSTREQGRARFSFMGGRGGSLWQRITYSIADDSTITRRGVLTFENPDGQIKEMVIQGGFLDFLKRELELRQCRKEDYINLPFDFSGGFIGYLGYELKEECGAKSNRHKSPMPDAGMFLADRVVVIDHDNDDIYVLALFQDSPASLLRASSKVYPENSLSPVSSSLIPRQKMVTVCSGLNEQKDVYSNLTSLLGASYGISERLRNGSSMAGTGEQRERRDAEAWVQKITAKIRRLAQKDHHEESEQNHHRSVTSSLQTVDDDTLPSFAAEKSRKRYIEDVKRSQEFITDGQSYEVCLTTQFRRKIASRDTLGLYLALRETNPAPYASWLHFGKDGPCICSSSPERFLQLNRKGILEAKPIKGTVARGSTHEEDENLRQELKHSEKDQAENLMIVDLLRNDLGRVCEPGTVHVPSLMAVESYSTVHTMVSTVRGKKRPDVSAVDCVRAAFPGGSMTGAPKLSTMEIIDSLETSPRGVYSGSIGYFSFNSAFDLNIVIRTLVIHEGEASLGAGGAVIALSNPDAEYEEMLLKTRAPIRAVGKYEKDLKLVNASDHSGVLLPPGT